MKFSFGLSFLVTLALLATISVAAPAPVNEGLDQHNSTDDTDFLSSWKACMERISREGKLMYCQHCHITV